MRLWLHRAVTAACLGGTALGTGAALRQSPFTAPMVERSAAEARVALERAMARTVTAAWIEPRLTEALDQHDRDRVAMLAELAVAHDIALSDPLPARIAALAAETSGWLAQAADCALCAWDILSCPSITLIAVCALPVELTPAGDANALRRAAMAALADQPVDGLEVGLALAGLGASALVPFTGGSSATVKTGTTMLRLARRLDTLTPGFLNMLRQASDLPVAWSRLPDFALGRAPLSAVTDTARLADLGRVAQDVGTIGRNTSAADALLLLRHVESAEDAARLARLSAVAGPDTRRVIEVLGSARAFRALVRLSDLAMAALALIYALMLQLAMLAASWLGGRALSALTRPRAGQGRVAVR